jgi:ribosome-binding protein aMBF1 (putative translation factor)
MKKGKAVKFNLNLRKEMKSPRFAAAFQREVSRNRLAEQIAAMRQKRGWTQGDLAHRVGTTQSGIARLENPNYRNYSLKMLEKVATVLSARLVVGLEEIRRNAA